MSIVSQVTRKTKPEIKQELQDWNYNFFEDFAMLGAPEKVAYNFKTLGPLLTIEYSWQIVEIIAASAGLSLQGYCKTGL